MASYPYLKRSVVNFCNSTAIHGCAYFFAQSRNKFETLFWVFIVFLCLCFSTYMIYDAFHTWAQSPFHFVETSFSVDPKDVPFPALTVCPNQGSDELFLFSKHLNTFKFSCSHGGCNETEKIRHSAHVKAFLDGFNSYLEDNVAKLRGNLDWQKYFTAGTSTTSTQGGTSSPFKYSDAMASLIGETTLQDYPRRHGELLPRDEQDFSSGAASIVIDELINYQIEQNVFSEGRWTPVYKEYAFEQKLAQLEEEFNTIGVIREPTRRADTLKLYPNFYCPNGICYYYDKMISLIKRFSLQQEAGTLGLGTLFYTLVNSLQEKHAILDTFREYINISTPHIGEMIDQIHCLNGKSPNMTLALYKDTCSYNNANSTTQYNIMSSSHLRVRHDHGEKMLSLLKCPECYPGTEKIPDKESKPTLPYEKHHLDSLGWSATKYALSLELDLSSALTNVPHLDMTSGLVSLVQALAGPNNHAAEGQVIELDDSMEILRHCHIYSNSDNCSKDMCNNRQCRDFFSVGFTSLGQCSVFNRPSLDQLYKKSFLKANGHLFLHEEGIQHSQLTLDDIYRIRVMLDVHNTESARDSKDGTFVLSVSAPQDFVNMETMSYLGAPGQLVKLAVYPRHITADKSIKSSGIGSRPCLFEDETDKLDIYKLYTKDNCMYEKGLRLLSKENYSCVPWDMVHKQKEADFCNGFKSMKFKEDLAKSLNSKMTSCLEGCNYFDYSVHVDTQIIDTHETCRDHAVLEALYSKSGFQAFKILGSFRVGYLLGDRALPRYCRSKLDADVVIVDLTVSASGIIESNMQYSTNALTQISLIGGSISLFNGLSLTILLEVTLWLMDSFFTIIDTSASDNTPQKSKATFIHRMKSNIKEYFLSSTLHGLVFLVQGKFLLVKVFCALSLITLITVPLYLSVENFSNSKPLIHYSQSLRTFTFTYPTITICPIQYADIFNLPRILMNLDGGHYYDQLDAFINYTIEHDWLDFIGFSVIDLDSQLAVTEAIEQHPENSQDISERCPESWTYVEEFAACYMFLETGIVHRLADPAAEHLYGGVARFEMCENKGQLAVIESEQELMHLAGMVDEKISERYLVGATETSNWRNFYVWHPVEYVGKAPVLFDSDLSPIFDPESKRECVYINGNGAYVRDSCTADPVDTRAALCKGPCDVEVGNPEVMFDGQFSAYWKPEALKHWLKISFHEAASDPKVEVVLHMPFKESSIDFYCIQVLTVLESEETRCEYVERKNYLSFNATLQGLLFQCPASSGSTDTIKIVKQCDSYEKCDIAEVNIATSQSADWLQNKETWTLEIPDFSNEYQEGWMSVHTLNMTHDDDLLTYWNIQNEYSYNPSWVAVDFGGDAVVIDELYIYWATWPLQQYTVCPSPRGQIIFYLNNGGESQSADFGDLKGFASTIYCLSSVPVVGFNLSRMCESARDVHISEIEFNGTNDLANTKKWTIKVSSTAKRDIYRDPKDPKSCYDVVQGNTKMAEPKNVFRLSGSPNMPHHEAKELCQLHGMHFSHIHLDHFMFYGLRNVIGQGSKAGAWTGLMYDSHTDQAIDIYGNVVSFEELGVPGIWSFGGTTIGENSYSDRYNGVYLDNKGNLTLKSGLPREFFEPQICKAKLFIRQVYKAMQSTEYNWREECGRVRGCKDLVQAIISSRLRPDESSKRMPIGTILSEFVEYVVGSSFHPAHFFEENKLIIDQTVKFELEIYEVLQELYSVVFRTDLNNSYALHEVPLLFQWFHNSLTEDKTITQRENASAIAYFTNKVEWEREEIGTSKYMFIRASEAWMDKMFLAILGDYRLTDTLQKIFLPNHYYWEDKQYNKEYIKLNLTKDIALEFISEAYRNNTFGKKLRPLLKEILHMMRFSTVSSYPNVSSADFQSRFPDWRGDPEFLDSDYEKETNRLNMVQLCKLQYTSHRVEDCKSEWFSVVPSFVGVCSAFNSLGMQSVFKVEGQEYLEAFQEAFGTGIDTEQQLMTFDNAGEVPKLTLLLDIHRSNIARSEQGQIRIAFNEHNSLLDVISDPILLNPGIESTITIKISTFYISEDAKLHNFNLRKCLLEEKEAPVDTMNLFHNYSQSSCLYACGVKLQIEKLNCTPWNFVHLKSDIPLCTRDDNYNFMNFFTTQNILQHCAECLLPCTRTEYSYQTDTKMMDPDQECKDKELFSVAMHEIAEEFEKFAWVYQQINKWRYETSGEVLPYSDLEKCREDTNLTKVRYDFVKANIQIFTTDLKETVLDVGINLVDKAIIFGGNMALFVGLSFLSLVELIYWIYLTLTSPCVSS